MEEKTFELTPEQSAAFAKVRAFINGTPEVESLLYDLDLLPETIVTWRADVGERDWARMMRVVGYFMAFAERMERQAAPMTAEQFYRAEAERRVLRMRGSYDAPGFEACVRAEIEEMRGP